jgi:fatty-acyl-CoA synthase
MDLVSAQEFSPGLGLLRIEDCVDAEGDIVLPPGVTLLSLIDRNIANVGDSVAYRYLDFSRSDDGQALELTWTQLGTRMRAIGAHLQHVAERGDRVAVLAPQGLDYVAGFFAAIKAGNIAVPLFAPELPGHAERLDTALRDAQPAVILTTAAVVDLVRAFVDENVPTAPPLIVTIDDVPDSAAEAFLPVEIDVEDVSHLQYTSGATRPPVGVELTHRAVGTNLLQMILSIDMLDRRTRGVSWLPLYHDMGLSMIGFPAVYGGHSTLMSPTAFIRRPQRWIRALAAESRAGRVVSAAPNFAYEWTAQRGLPAVGEVLDLSDVVLIIGSEPVSMAAIRTFSYAFAPHGLSRAAMKPSYGIAEATLFVSTTEPNVEASVAYFDRDRLNAGRAVPVAPDAPLAVPQVSCGRIARSLSCVIVDPVNGEESPDGRVGEIWLHGNNVGRGYWGRPAETESTFGARLASRLATGSHAEDVPVDGTWLRTGDLGVYLDGEFYVTGRLADLITIGGRSHYPQDVEVSAADATAIVRRGYVAAFTTPPSEPENDSGDEQLVIVAERAAGTARVDPQPAVDAIRAEVLRRHGVSVADVLLLPAGAIPRTTSGKLARRACRAQYLLGGLGA